MSTPISTKIKVSRDQLLELVRLAILRGYQREDPMKRWTMNERKDAVRWYIQKGIQDVLTPRPIFESVSNGSR